MAVAAIAVRDPQRPRGFEIPSHLLMKDWKAVVHNPAVHVVVELMGGTTTAREAVLAALRHGKPVVTANKALLSAHGEELFATARAHRANLYYEASVAGGIPIIKILRESLVGNRTLALRGIVNGTCNYILTKMGNEGRSFGDVLKEAQALGYAEADPTFDVGGFDTAHKLAVLTSLAFGTEVNLKAIEIEGIEQITLDDIRQDLIDIARGGKVAYSSGGVGNSTHLIAEMFSRAAGVTMAHVPYKGVAPAINALLVGEVPIMFIPPTAAVPLVKAGRLRALAFTGKQRWSVMPDTPTIMESGLPGFHKDSGWNAWLAPAKTPAAIVERLQRAAHASVHSPKVSAMLVAGGYDPLGNTPAEARKFMAEEIELYGRIVKAVGLEAQ